jgi:hypothetical protein
MMHGRNPLNQKNQLSEEGRMNGREDKHSILVEESE